MKVTIKSDNIGYGESELCYSGNFVKEWQIACFLEKELYNGLVKTPAEQWVEAIKKWPSKYVFFEQRPEATNEWARLEIIIDKEDCNG